MSPEELHKMFQSAFSFQGENPSPKNSSSFSRGSIASDLSPDLLKTASDMMAKMSQEDVQKMFEMASSLKRDDVTSSSPSAALHTNAGVIPPNVSPDMLKMATDMMGKMSTEDRKRMFEMASSLRGQKRAPSPASSYSNGLRSNDTENRENLKVDDRVAEMSVKVVPLGV
ncbi:hypothetical protein OROGR_002663 [Orobanche gracilis]